MTIATAERDTCAAIGHAYNPHHHHCYHCGRMSGNHRTWCPDGGSKPDAGFVGWWMQAVGCKA